MKHKILLATSMMAVAILTVGGSAVASERPNPEELIDRQMSETVNEPLVQTLETLEEDRIIGPHSEYLDTIGYASLAEDGGLILHYWPGADNAADFVRDTRASAKDAQLSVSFALVGYNPAAVSKTARALSEPTAELLHILGVDSVDSVIVENTTGAITANVPSRDGVVVVVDGRPVTLAEGNNSELQNRVDDFAPYAGGIQLSGNGVGCTAGFNWRKWGSGVLMSSTAEHCFRSSAVGSNWANAGTPMGYRYYYSKRVDTMLIQGRPYRSSFRPAVFIGPANTGVERFVASNAAIDVVGAVVALSGGRSGLNAGNNVARVVYDGGAGPFRATTVTRCINGDSGSPWLTTQRSGRAVAHGQHGGILAMNNGTKYCYFMPMTPISAALSASVYVKK